MNSADEREMQIFMSKLDAETCFASKDYRNSVRSYQDMFKLQGQVLTKKALSEKLLELSGAIDNLEFLEMQKGMKKAFDEEERSLRFLQEAYSGRTELGD